MRVTATLKVLNSVGTGLWKCAEMRGSITPSLRDGSFELQPRRIVAEEGNLSIPNKSVTWEVGPPRYKEERCGRWIDRPYKTWETMVSGQILRTRTCKPGLLI